MDEDAPVFERQKGKGAPVAPARLLSTASAGVAGWVCGDCGKACTRRAANTVRNARYELDTTQEGVEAEYQRRTKEWRIKALYFIYGLHIQSVIHATSAVGGGKS